MRKADPLSESGESRSTLLKFARSLVPTTKPYKGRRARVQKRDGVVTATSLLGLRVTVMVDASEKEKEAMWQKTGKKSQTSLVQWKRMHHPVWLTDWRWKVQWLS